MLDIIDIPGIPRGADVGMKLNRFIFSKLGTTPRIY